MDTLTSAGRLVRSQLLAVIALLAVLGLLTAGTAYAATAAKNSVTSRSIKNGAVKTVDLAADAVTGPQVLDNSLTGADVNEATLGQVPSAANAGTAANATSLGGAPASAYLRGSVYKAEAPTAVGTPLGDGTFTKAFACNAGDLLLSGGPASVSATSDVVESFPTPGSTTSWSARIQDNGVADAFTVVVLCLDQP
jgi:hypothetical protein